MYSTRDEMEYIKTIGTHSLACKNTPKKVLLKKYIAGCEKRKNWGTLNSVSIINFAKSELQKYTT
jgi:saccharopine dehydrogenase-like NADP-dependent oxidoreductase